jgi:hypothetical protein
MKGEVIDNHSQKTTVLTFFTYLKYKNIEIFIQ